MTDTATAPGTVTACDLTFRITDGMVERFAALTGDRSSLHVSDAFARRSAFRRPIAHGLLSVAFLPLLPLFEVPGRRCSINSLTGRFLTPVHVGEALRLSAGPTQSGSGPDESTFDYRISDLLNGTSIVTGTCGVRFNSRSTSRVIGATSASAAALPTDQPDLKNFRLEDLQSGLQDQPLEFSVSESAVAEFLRLLGDGVEFGAEIDADAFTGRFDVASLLPVLLLSTSVGMLSPGQSATFLEFSAQVERGADLDAEYRLDGRVSRRSLSTRIVKKEIVVVSVNRPDAVLLRGSVAALVNKAANRMPTMGELRGERLGDWGLKDKVVLVTGASRGIGETTAKLLALCGAKVVVNYHRGADDGARVVGEIREAGGEAIGVRADVSDAAQVADMVGRVISEYGSIHVLINNAARDCRPVPFLNLSWDDVQQDLDVIARGAFLCCQKVIPVMLAESGGRIVNIASVATDDPPPNQTKYVMAKSALVGLTRSLSIEFASRNILVNLVVPNFVETDFVAHVQEGFRAKLAGETPMRRHATALDVARAVLFLASPQASFTTGQKLMVTGGGAPYA